MNYAKIFEIKPIENNNRAFFYGIFSSIDLLIARSRFAKFTT